MPRGNAGGLAGWGHAGKAGVTMPAKGRMVQRPYDQAERDAIAEAAKTCSLSAKQAQTLLGRDTRDVYLNDRAYWKNVPAGVWDYYIGGYQVMKKWLSYREEELLDRALRREEAREVTGMARRLAAIVLLQPSLDENYRRVAAHAYAWPGTLDSPGGYRFTPKTRRLPPATGAEGASPFMRKPYLCALCVLCG